MPRWLFWTVALVIAIAMVPYACIARARVDTSPKPRVHLIPDMDSQPKFKTQKGNPLFMDGRAMRAHVPGTVARGWLKEGDHFYRGIVDGQWATTLPMEVDRDLILRGQERYEIFCTPCHGLSGYGDGMVSRRAEALQEGAWVPPSSFHDAPANTRSDGHIFNTITNGIRTMSPYASSIEEQDRWAIVAYIRALQRSQAATVEDVPNEVRGTLR